MKRSRSRRNVYGMSDSAQLASDKVEREFDKWWQENKMPPELEKKMQPLMVQSYKIFAKSAFVAGAVCGLRQIEKRFGL